MTDVMTTCLECFILAKHVIHVFHIFRSTASSTHLPRFVRQPVCFSRSMRRYVEINVVAVTDKPCGKNSLDSSRVLWADDVPVTFLLRFRTLNAFSKAMHFCAVWSELVCLMKTR